jgi:hypothetical protein
LILDDGGDLGSGGTFESGHLGYLEGIILYEPSNPQSAMAARELVETGVKDAIAWKQTKTLALPATITMFGSRASNPRSIPTRRLIRSFMQNPSENKRK